LNHIAMMLCGHLWMIFSLLFSPSLMPSFAVVAANTQRLQVCLVVCATLFEWLDMVNTGGWPLASSAQWFFSEDG
jgi:hypothetical protein